MPKHKPQTDLTISRILKVNHAGECGAINIYAAQIFVVKRTCPDLVDTLQAFLVHEIEHRQLFLSAMKPRKSRPCAAIGLWSLGGSVLGLGTALLGRNAIMVCTQAIEETVHRHLQSQIDFLSEVDEPLKGMIQTIQQQEEEHLDYARSRVKASWVNPFLFRFIVISTEIVIWLSTQGAVSRMEKALK